MATPQPTEYNKRIVVWYLKRYGDVHDASGRASSTLRDNLKQVGASFAQSTLSTVVKALDDEGIVKREMENGRRVSSIRLIQFGSYMEDPFNEDGRLPQPVGGNERGPRQPKIDRLLAEIESLPLDERMMLAGQVVDSCAAALVEIAPKIEKLEKLRDVFGDL